ncbi:MAG: hypothetical protein R3176_08015, partial [Woeseiaceae bacterium]|nr:hypothetical protein [Woeseiaceae bacterium]
PFTNTESGGELVVIDTPQYVENTQPVKDFIGMLTGPAQLDATVNDVLTEPGTPSPGGRYSSVYPILDGTGRLLVSWSQCRLVEQLADDGDPATDDTRIVPCTAERLANLFVQPDPDNPVTPDPGTFSVAPPLYGIWMYDPRDDTQRPVVTGEEGWMITEVVAADPKTAPPVVLDGINDYPLDPSLVDVAEGVINIRSVYDFDGTAVVDIPALADPAQTDAADRPARFLRVVKAVSIPDEDLSGIELDNTDFGVSTVQGMKEIVGYAMIEPDGSVMARVPANVALAISVVDENGKRITGRHMNWLQVRPGQELSCNGCHVRNAQDPVTLEPISHGRYDAFDSAYAGAPAGMLNFPNTDPAWFIGEPGQTMAEVRASVTCSTDSCSSLEPSLNVIYRDVWTDPMGTPDPDIDYLYTDLTTPAPASLACQQDWQALCRSVINYLEHIQPLWEVSRPVVDALGNQIGDNQCTGCHAFPYVDPATNQLAPPPGQLELTSQLSADEPDHVHSYRELLVTDNLQEVVGGQLVDVLQPTGEFDIDGNPILDVVPIASPASIAGARASGRFFAPFEDPANSHYDMLSGAERRLIAEWLDVGAQYYNNPFVVPQ